MSAGARVGLAASDAEEVAAAYAAGRPTGPMTYAARGELGRVWHLPAGNGDLAVKELFHPPTEAVAAADVRFQLLARSHGVNLPPPVLRRDGRVMTRLSGGVTVRAYAWLELTPLAERPLAEIGALLAILHRLGEPTATPPVAWFTEPVGAVSWRALDEAAEERQAPFAPALRRALPDLLELEALLPIEPRPDNRRCHLDLDGSNLARDAEGRLVVLDWENSGPAAPVHELAMLAAEYAERDGRRLIDAYRDAAGPARITGIDDFAMAVAVQGHLVSFYANRWLAALDAEDVERSRWRLDDLLSPGLLSPRRLDRLAGAFRDG